MPESFFKFIRCSYPVDKINRDAFLCLLRNIFVSREPCFLPNLYSVRTNRQGNHFRHHILVPPTLNQIHSPLMPSKMIASNRKKIGKNFHLSSTSLHQTGVALLSFPHCSCHFAKLLEVHPVPIQNIASDKLIFPPSIFLVF